MVVIVLVYYSFEPGKLFISFNCPLFAMTGLYCPGCGSQRAIHSLLHLRFAEVLKQNILILPTILFVVYHLTFRFFNRKFGWRLPDILYNKKTPWIILVIIIVFWIIRNIPVEPFKWLAPD